ncbi:Bug family tripartite tricarboxylate transporter substrate binding protein [Nisaea sp.]|uniref:Bug family tripartite tricarboxylate transporter substrate binding protein n=1 Tax=Nisaea sp. TaxID=2024842 RepID=UPI003B52FAEA
MSDSVLHNRRDFLKTAALTGVAGASLATFGGSAHAADFPAETLNVVTHAGPGGGTDITTRMMMLRARRVFKQDMVVVNKRGGSGSAALMYTHSRPRDGYTFMTITQSHIFQIVQKKVPVTIDDMVGLARATDDPQIVSVGAGSKIKSLDDLIAASKDKEGGLKWGTTFVGGADHVGIHNFAKAAGGIPYTIVPFKGGGDIVTNLVSGNVDVALLNYAEGESQYNAGELRPVVSLSEEPIDALDGVKTARDAGVDALASTVRGFACLSGVEQNRVDALSDGLVKAMKHSVYQGYLASGGMPKSSVVGSEKWTAHIRRIYDESTTALTELGML